MSTHGYVLMLLPQIWLVVAWKRIARRQATSRPEPAYLGGILLAAALTLLALIGTSWAMWMTFAPIIQ